MNYLSSAQQSARLYAGHFSGECIGRYLISSVDERCCLLTPIGMCLIFRTPLLTLTSKVLNLPLWERPFLFGLQLMVPPIVTLLLSKVHTGGEGCE